MLRICKEQPNGELRPEKKFVILVKEAVVFSNWIPFKRQVELLGLKQNRNVILDMSETRLIDHTVMEKLHELKREFLALDLTLEVVGLESHLKFSQHPDSGRRRN